MPDVGGSRRFFSKEHSDGVRCAPDADSSDPPADSHPFAFTAVGFVRLRRRRVHRRLRLGGPLGGYSQGRKVSYRGLELVLELVCLRALDELDVDIRILNRQ